MAVIKIEAKKDTRCMQTICLIRGDRRTQILRFGVNRFDGGVDLSDLTWVIKTANAKGVEDVFEPEAVEIGENRITVDWLVDGSVTDADGMAKYELNGLDATEDGKGVVWKGGMGTMSLRADIGENFADIDMTNIDRLVLYVEGRLQHIIDLTDELQNAGETANAAATAANAGAARAEAAAIAANTGATAATEAASNASAAAEAANTAALPHAQLYGMRVRGETAGASGNPVTFLPDAGSLLQPVTVLDVQQQGSGEPSPSNIRPIIGYDKLGLNHAGKNLCPYVQHNEVVALRLFAGRTYVVSIADSSASDITLLLYNDGTGASYFQSVPINRVEGGRRYGTFTLDRDTTHINFTWGATSALIEPQIEESLVVTPYEPYQGKLHTVQIGQTVYGFRYEWLTGKGLIEWVTDILDGSEEWIDSTAIGLKVIFTPGSELPIVGVNTIAYMSHFKRSDTPVLSGMSLNEFTFANWNMSDSSTLSIRTDMSMDEFKAYLAGQKAAGTPVQFTRKLATPVEIGPFTPHIISAADPEQINILYGDGRIDVEYVKPLRVSIGGGSGGGSVLAPVQSVNGKTGDVKLTAADVGALPAKTEIPKPYTLPTASAEVKGGVKVGEGLQMDGDVLGVVPEPELEFIETIVCDGTYGNVSRSNLSLKRVVLYIYTQAATAAASIGIEFKNGKEMFGYAWMGNGINTAERWMYANAVSGGKQEAYIEATGPSTSKYTSNGLSRTPSRYDGDTPITRVNIYASGGAMIPTGSTIEIWGVRANA